MTLEKITAVILPHQGRQQQGRTSLAPGDILHLSPDSVVGEDLLVKNADGQLLRLLGVGSLTRQMTAGELLLLQVVESAPRLTLRLLDPRAPAMPQPAQTSSMDFDAMRTNQLALQQLSWARPDPAWIAANWHARVMDRFHTMDHAAAQTAAKSLLASQALPHEPAALVPTLPESDRWLFHVFGWGGMPIRLRLARLLPDEQGRAPRPFHAYMLQLDFELPGWGQIRLWIRLLNRSIGMLVEVERRDIVDRVKHALPDMQAALAENGLRLFHTDVRIRTEQANRALAQHVPFQRPDRDNPPALLFRAAVDITLVLTAASGNAPSPAYR